MGLSTLWRLRIIYFSFGLMFWYGIEQLFLDKVIADPSGRAVVSFVFLAIFMLCDIPTGIIADRLGRKNALLFAASAQLLAVIALGSSTTLWMYVVGTILYAVYTSFENGTFQAFLYDHLLSTGDEKHYAKYLGQASGLFLGGAAVANLASGMIVDTSGSLRLPYIISIIPPIITIFLITTLREPATHSLDQEGSWIAHLKSIVRIISTTHLIWPLSTILLGTTIGFMTIGEFGQVYLLSFNISATTLGWLWAVNALVAGVAQSLSHHVERQITRVIVLFTGVLVAFSLARSWIGIPLFIIVYALVEAVSSALDALIQHRIPSRYRAGVFSAISFLCCLFTLPVIVGFNALYHALSIQDANSVFAIIVACLIGVGLLSYRVMLRHQ